MSERKKIKMDSWWEDREYDPGHDLDMPEGTTKELRESNSLLDFSEYFLSDSENEDTDSKNEDIITIDDSEDEDSDYENGDPIPLNDSKAEDPDSEIGDPITIGDSDDEDTDIEKDLSKLQKFPKVDLVNLRVPQQANLDPEERAGEDAVIVCPVCWEKMVDVTAGGGAVWSLECGHLICGLCLDGVLTSNNSKVCPTCREVVQEEDLRPVYL